MNIIKKSKEQIEAELIAEASYQYCLNSKYNFTDKMIAFKERYINEIRFFESKIFEANIPFLSYKFARDIENADVEKHLEFITKFPDNSRQVLDFATNVKGANIEKCQEYLIKDSKESKTVYDLIEFARNVKECDFKLIEDYILSLKSAKDSYEFCTIEGSNFKEHEKVILESRNLEYCFWFFVNYHTCIDGEPFLEVLKGSKYESMTRTPEKYDYYNVNSSFYKEEDPYILSMQRIKETVIRQTKN